MKITALFDENIQKIIQILNKKPATFDFLKKTSDLKEEIIKNTLKFLIKKNIVTFRRQIDNYIYEINEKNLHILYLYPLYLNYVYTNFSEDETEIFSAILFEGTLKLEKELDNKIFFKQIIEKIEFNPKNKKIKKEDLYFKIDFDILNRNIFGEICEKFFKEKYGNQMASVFSKTLISKECGQKRDNYQQILIEKNYFSVISGNYILNKKTIQSEILQSYYAKTLDVKVRRVLNFALSTGEFDDEDLYLKCLIPKTEIKFYVAELIKKGLIGIKSAAKETGYKYFCDLIQVKKRSIHEIFKKMENVFLDKDIDPIELFSISETFLVSILNLK